MATLAQCEKTIADTNADFEASLLRLGAIAKSAKSPEHRISLEAIRNEFDYVTRIAELDKRARTVDARFGRPGNIRTARLPAAIAGNRAAIARASTVGAE